MSEEQFAKLFKHMQKQFSLIDKKLDKLADKEDIDRVLRLLDKINKRQGISSDELLLPPAQK